MKIIFFTILVIFEIPFAIKFYQAHKSYNIIRETAIAVIMILILTLFLFINSLW